MAVPTYEVNAVTCKACSHTELADKAPEEQIYIDYKYYSSNSPDLNEHFTEYAEWLRSRLDLKAGAVHMDVGCNDGLLLEKTRYGGFGTVGIDPSPAATHAAEKGFKVYKDFLTEHLIRRNMLEESADVITCNNMMANVRDLNGFGRCLNRMLKKNGCVVVETLHFPTLVRNAVFEMINHEHYHYFSARSICQYFESIGLKPVSCDRTATKGGNMRCVARKISSSSGAAAIDPKLGEAEANIDMKRFLSILETARDTLSHKIEEARDRGPIAGFGAVGGSTILMYLLKLQDNVEFFVDDHPSRHGCFVPGSGIPVISPEEYHKRKPGLTILFAWRFGRQIAAKHQSSMPAGHEFLLANTGEALSTSGSRAILILHLGYHSTKVQRRVWGANSNRTETACMNPPEESRCKKKSQLNHQLNTF
jgi:2-polyprenyl-3-methyl-5-hydroxy-6-metoxy-1,4-benzoquinol methylase